MTKIIEKNNYNAKNKPINHKSQTCNIGAPCL